MGPDDWELWEKIVRDRSRDPVGYNGWIVGETNLKVLKHRAKPNIPELWDVILEYEVPTSNPPNLPTLIMAMQARADEEKQPVRLSCGEIKTVAYPGGTAKAVEDQWHRSRTLHEANAAMAAVLRRYPCG